MEYPKIENLYARCPDTHVCGPQFGFRMPEVGLISKWLVTEKVDGMNMRVIFETFPENGVLLRFTGRTDRALIPNDLREHMRAFFTLDTMVAAFRGEDGALPERIVLYGEGFGPGIQGAAGAAYGGAKRFILFDVLVNQRWLDWADVVNVAAKLGVPHVPVFGGPVDLEGAKDCVRETELLIREPWMVEGLVARTDPYIFDWRGNRIMFKYKVRDL